MPEDDSYIDLPKWATHYPRWGSVHGKHHIPSIGTLYHRKRWFSARVRVRFLPAGGTDRLAFTTDVVTMAEIITAGTVAEARTLISLRLTGVDP
ncbi:hypothetical protein ACFVOK_13315 [Streptomyces sp. NPDC057798]|uniref:hypothetical protein n=1 Tax=Streptomyces sp. NPDC057798 TaxID=3346252 RepID=UPI00367A4405